MILEVIIEKLDGDIVIPLKDGNKSFQFRSDGILVDSNLHLWEEIMFVQVINRELLDSLKKKA